MAAIPITAGRFIPETDAERISTALREFERLAGPKFLKAISDAIVARETGCARLIVYFDKGSLSKAQFQTDYGIALDTDNG